MTAALALAPEDLAQVFGRQVTSYDVEAIDPHLRLHSVTGGVYRVRAGDDSCVIKVVRHGVDATPDGLWQSGADVGHRNYWKREWLAFHSGLLDTLPGELRAPRALLTNERDNGECWIWMEDVRGRTGSQLRLEDYGVIGHALGTTHGAYASGRVALPEYAWLSRNWLRGWVETCAHFVDSLRDDAQWSDPRLAVVEPLRAPISALWDRREELLAIAGEPPLTITHWDFWPANLYVSDDAVLAIDWSQIGLSGITHDLDQLTLDPVWMLVRADASLHELEGRVLSSYLAGLRAGGFAADEGTVRRWYAAAAALRYAWLIGGQPATLADGERARFQESRFGREMDEIVATKARVAAHAVGLGEAALAR